MAGALRVVANACRMLCKERGARCVFPNNWAPDRAAAINGTVDALVRERSRQYDV